METIFNRQSSANERELALLLEETTHLKTLLSAALEEVAVLQKKIAALYRNPELVQPEEDMEFSLGQLEDLKSDCKEYVNKLHNHKYDLQGMRECDDVSCESFFQAEHLQLKKDVQDFLIRFNHFRNQSLMPPETA